MYSAPSQLSPVLASIEAIAGSSGGNILRLNASLWSCTRAGTRSSTPVSPRLHRVKRHCQSTLESWVVLVRTRPSWSAAGWTRTQSSARYRQRTRSLASSGRPPRRPRSATGSGRASLQILAARPAKTTHPNCKIYLLRQTGRQTDRAVGMEGVGSPPIRAPRAWSPLPYRSARFRRASQSVSGRRAV